MIFGLNFSFLTKYWFYYVDGLKVTLELAFWTLILATAVGVVMGMIRVQNYKIISSIIDGWINFIRGVRERVCQDDFCKFSKFKYLSAEKTPNISCRHIS